MPNPVTIHQIAEAAGVGTATVDRVLNNRPGVNPDTVRKVRDAMAKLGGGPPMRGRPRTTTNFRFSFALPDIRRGFFDLADRVIAQAAGDFRHQHITEITHRLPVHDPNQCAAELLKLSDMDALAVLAPDVPQVKLAINELVRAGVHVVTLFSDVPGSLRETFIGADNRAAGRTAGFLVGRSLDHETACHCALFSPPTRFAAELDRRIGFQQAIEERNPNAQVLRCFEVPESEEEAFAYAHEALSAADIGRLAGAYCVGPGAFGIARALEKLGLDARATFIAHDMLELHRSMLISGSMTYLLHQDVHYAVTSAARVLRALCEGVRGALNINNPRVEILTPENLA